MLAVSVFLLLPVRICIGWSAKVSYSYSVFVCSLILLGIKLLRKCSVTPLPSVLLSWFYEKRKNLINQELP